MLTVIRALWMKVKYSPAMPMFNAMLTRQAVHAIVTVRNENGNAACNGAIAGVCVRAGIPRRR